MSHLKSAVLEALCPLFRDLVDNRIQPVEAVHLDQVCHLQPKSTNMFV